MKGEWLGAAMADDGLVAELLLRLKQSDSLSTSLPPLDWGIRRPRSKSAASVKKDREATRRSPTTPLSWSTGGASPSDSYEELSRSSASVARSKSIATNETTSSLGATKRPRRKKTFAQLKEEEIALLNEKKLLKEELDSLHKTMVEQRSFNKSLKRIKLDLQSHCKTEASTSRAATDSGVLKQVKSEHLSEPRSFDTVRDGASNERPIFVLPDLNETPEDPHSMDEMR